MLLYVNIFTYFLYHIKKTFMKKIILSVLLIIPFLTGCDALGELTKVPLPISQSITIPATPIIGSQNIETPSIETGIDSVLKSAGVSSDFVEKITLSKMEFSLSSSTDDLSFLKDVNIYIVSSGKENVKIASATNVGEVNPLKFKTLDVDIKSFILGDSFKLKLEISTDKPFTSAKEIEIDMEFLLDLKVLGM